MAKAIYTYVFVWASELHIRQELVINLVAGDCLGRNDMICFLGDDSRTVIGGNHFGLDHSRAVRGGIWEHKCIS